MNKVLAGLAGQGLIRIGHGGVDVLDLVGLQLRAARLSGADQSTIT